MKSLIYILLCFIAVNLSTAMNINVENHNTRPKEGVDIATDDILTVKQEIEDEKLTEINYDIYWTAYKQRWLKYGKQRNTQRASRKADSEKRDKRHVHESTIDDLFQNLKTERRNLLREKQDVISRKSSNETHQAWDAYKQKWNEYVKKWEEYNEKQEGKTDKRDKRDVQVTDGVSNKLKTERVNLLKEKYDIINGKPNGNSTHQAWDTYKEKWNEYGKKWNESHENEGKSRTIDKRDVQDDGLSQNLQPERINLIKEKQDKNENNRFSIDWTAYKQRWLEYRKRWTAQHATLDTEIEREKRTTRDVQEPKKDEEHTNLDNKRKHLIRQKAIINEQPERYDRDSKYGIEYKQKWEEYGNKWNAYHAGPEADKILGDRGRRDVGSETGKWDEVGQMWKTYGQQWIGYGKKFDEFVAKKETERERI